MSYMESLSKTAGAMLELGGVITVDQCDELQVVAYTFEIDQHKRFENVVEWIRQNAPDIQNRDWSINLFTPSGLLEYPVSNVKRGDDE